MSIISIFKKLNIDIPPEEQSKHCLLEWIEILQNKQNELLFPYKNRFNLESPVSK